MTEPRPETRLDPGTLSEPCRRVITLFNDLTRDDLDRLGSLYAPDAHFRDPFNDVTGLPAIRHIFEDMFDKLVEPSFEITGAVESESPRHQAFLTWDFDYGLGKRRCRAHGGTLIRFDEHGRVTAHHDYWDAAGGLYENLPVVGALMRWLRARVSA